MDAFYGRTFSRVNRSAYGRKGPGFWRGLLPDVEATNVQAMVEAGRQLEAKDRRMVREAAARLAEATGGGPSDAAAGDDGADTPAEDGDAEDPLDVETVALLDGHAWRELIDGLRRRCRVPGLAHVPEVVRAVMACGPLQAVCEVIEQHGTRDGLRLLLAATSAHPAPLWADSDGVIVVARRVPDGVDWQVVEDWRSEAAA